jgi:hypothetical protein
VNFDWYTLHADGTYSPQAAIAEKTDPGVDFKIAVETATDPEGREFVVSTVFLGLDHRYGEGSPLVFETMIFPSEDGEITDWCELFGDRYTTIEQARAGHADATQMVRDGKVAS